MKSLILFLLMVFPLVAPAQNGTIRGRVVDALTAEPLTGAKLRLKKQSSVPSPTKTAVS